MNGHQVEICEMSKKLLNTGQGNLKERRKKILFLS